MTQKYKEGKHILESVRIYKVREGMGWREWEGEADVVVV